MAALGAEILVPTVEGAKVLKVPAGTQSSSQLVMRDLGVPHLNNPSRRGDHVVHVVVETPTKLSGEERKLLEQLAEIRHEKLKVSAPVPDKSDAATDRDSASGTDHKADNKNLQSGSNSKKKKSHEKDPEPAEAEDKGIFDKIVDVFRPKE